MQLLIEQNNEKGIVQQLIECMIEMEDEREQYDLWEACTEFLGNDPRVIRYFFELLLKETVNYNKPISSVMEFILGKLCETQPNNFHVMDNHTTQTFNQNFATCSLIDLMVFIQNIPAHVKEINMDNIGLNRLGYHLIPLLRQVPLTVKKINLMNNNLFKALSLKEAHLFIGKLLGLPEAKRFYWFRNGQTEDIERLMRELHFLQNSLLYYPKSFKTCFAMLAPHFTKNICPLLETVDLSDKHLELLDEDVLVQDISEIPIEASSVLLNRNYLFNNKTPIQRDIFLQKISKIPNNERLDLSDNGETALCRILLPLLSMIKTGSLSMDMAALIIAYLPPRDGGRKHGENRDNRGFLQNTIVKLVTHDNGKLLLDCYEREGGATVKSFYYSRKTPQELMKSLHENSSKNPEGASAKALTHFCLK